MATIQIRPSELRYSQDSISGYFRNRQRLDVALWNLLRDADNVFSPVDDLPMMSVVKHEGHYVVFNGNRRLYLLKTLESAGIINEVDVVISFVSVDEFNKRYTTTNGGVSISVRSGVTEEDLDDVIAKYRRKRRGLPVSDDED